MKILIVNCVYGSGSTGAIIKNLRDGLLLGGDDCCVCFARGEQSVDDHVIKLTGDSLMMFQALCSRISGNVYGCSIFSTKRLIQEVQSYKPDVVNLHCVNANSINVVDTISFLKEHGIPTVVSLHAEFLYTGGCGHALNCTKWKTGCGKCPQFKHPNSQLPVSWFFDQSNNYWKGLEKAYSKFNNLVITGVSPWLTSRVKESPFFKENPILTVENGVDVSVFKPRAVKSLKVKLNLEHVNRIYVHPTPNFGNPLKGGKYVIEFAKRLQKIDASAKVVVVGNSGNEDKVPGNVILAGRAEDSIDLAAYYSMADATILASERETFSMVTAESLCCGTPVVGFKAGGPESICTKGHAEFVDYADVGALTLAAMNIKKTHEIASDYTPIFSSENMIRGYRDAYKLAYSL